MTADRFTAAAASRSPSALINDLLDMSRIEAGGFPLHDEPVELAEAAAHALLAVQRRAAG
jgi:signal transduction histidine kinase